MRRYRAESLLRTHCYCGDKSSGRGYYYCNCAPVYIRSFALTANNKQAAAGQVSLTSKMYRAKFTRPFESDTLNLNFKKSYVLKVVKYISQSFG